MNKLETYVKNDVESNTSKKEDMKVYDEYVKNSFKPFVHQTYDCLFTDPRQAKTIEAVLVPELYDPYKSIQNRITSYPSNDKYARSFFKQPKLKLPFLEKPKRNFCIHENSNSKNDFCGLHLVEDINNILFGLKIKKSIKDKITRRLCMFLMNQNILKPIEHNQRLFNKNKKYYWNKNENLKHIPNAHGNIIDLDVEVNRQMVSSIKQYKDLARNMDAKLEPTVPTLNDQDNKYSFVNNWVNYQHEHGIFAKHGDLQENDPKDNDMKFTGNSVSKSDSDVFYDVNIRRSESNLPN